MAKEKIEKKERYYYKKDGHAAYNLREPLSNILDDTTGYEEITKEEWDELTYVPPVEPTAEELAHNARVAEIAQLKSQLNATDYIVVKIAEMPEQADAIREEYAEVLANRKLWRARINELESQL